MVELRQPYFTTNYGTLYKVDCLDLMSAMRTELYDCECIKRRFSGKRI